MPSTITDIARLAKVSTATVDRVLNDRPGVREATRRLVLETAASLGYAHAAAHIAGFDFLLPTRPRAFMEQMAFLLRRAATDAPPPSQAGARAVRIHQIDYDQPERVAQLLGRIRSETSGIGIVTLDHLLIREALKAVIEHDVPVVTLLSDISSLPHQGFVGIDNRQAGRLAGHLVGRLAQEPGDVALLTGSPGYRGHEEREMGFRHILRTEFSHLRVLPTLETSEDAETGRALVAGLLDAHRELAAIYNIGAGSEGVALALERCAGERRPIFIAHELSGATRQFLLSGVIDAIVDENLPALAKRAIDRLASASRHRMLGICAAQDAQIITRENIPVDWF